MPELDSQFVEDVQDEDVQDDVQDDDEDVQDESQNEDVQDEAPWMAHIKSLENEIKVLKNQNNQQPAYQQKIQPGNEENSEENRIWQEEYQAAYRRNSSLLKFLGVEIPKESLDALVQQESFDNYTRTMSHINRIEASSLDYDIEEKQAYEFYLNIPGVKKQSKDVQHAMRVLAKDRVRYDREMQSQSQSQSQSKSVKQTKRQTISVPDFNKMQGGQAGKSKPGNSKSSKLEGLPAAVQGLSEASKKVYLNTIRGLGK